MFLKLSCVHVIIMVQFVDAPVSGGINAASAGTLTFMVNVFLSLDYSFFLCLTGGGRLR